MESIQNVKPTLNKGVYRLLEGPAVMKIINDPDFLMGWDVLYLSCPWATIFQSPKFVIQWYSLYHKAHEPVLVYAEEEGKVTGLLTLAKGKNGGAIMGAGRTDAHYQVWISGSDKEAFFIQQTLHLLRSRFKDEQILLEQLPPDAPMEWLTSDSYWARFCSVKPLKRPIIDLDEETLKNLMKKKQFRQNRNRLSRLGELRLANITTEEEFESIMDEISINYDFRQGAMYNRTPFRSNPLKKKFFQYLFREKLLFVTVLWLDKEILASVISVMGLKGYVHGAGINSQSPYYAKYSPGFINFIWFAEDLFHEGYKFLDMSTGGHSYKDRLASSSDTVYTFAFSPSLNKIVPQRTIFRLEEFVKTGLLRLKIDPKELKEFIKNKRMLSKEKINLVKKQGFSVITDFRPFPRNKKQGLYEISDNFSEEQKLPGTINENSIKDLLNFDSIGGLTTTWEFLHDCQKRVEGGETPYTWVANDLLLACIWMKNPQEGGKDEGLPQKAALLQGLYIRKTVRKDLGCFLTKVKEMASKPGLNDKIYFSQMGAIKPAIPNLNLVR